MRHRLAVAAMLSGFILAQAAMSQAPSEADRMVGIVALKLQSIPGPLPTYYSPRAGARAKYLQDLLGGEIAYYARLFQVSFSPIAMAVLDTKQWPVIAGESPYGMPSVDGTSPPVFVMPASWDEVAWMAVPKLDDVPPDMLRKALANGRRWEQVKFEGCDGIGAHEIGHGIVRQLGIAAQTKWFNEFLASYVGYAYLKSQAPAQALSNEIFWTVGLDNSPHPYTTLDDFDSRYEELQQSYPGNYGWYQLAIDQRVIEIYAKEGVDYLRKIREALPARGRSLDSAALLEKLEKTTPGWKLWAAQLQAGTLKAVLLPGNSG